MSSAPAQPGKVCLVGAGPGDPGLLTVRGAECLAAADLVMYDYLANQALLRHAAGAEAICLGKHGASQRVMRLWSQAEINQRMIDAARAGRVVVRLKAGDPMVFAHAAEEIAALEAAGVQYEIVPGITAALAAGSHAGIPLTHGQDASAVALVTGQERSGKSAPSLNYAALAQFPGTLVFYMGVTTAQEWTRRLIEAGKAPDTPVAVVRRCTWPDQQTYRCTLADAAQTIAQRRIRPPVILVVGCVAGQRVPSSWFTSRPLFGATVLVTRPGQQADELARPLELLGANVLLQPTIAILPPQDWGPVDAALARLGEFDWLVFSSANGVRSLVNRLLETADLRRLGNVRLAAIGPGTAEELSRYHLRADLVPAEYRAEALAAELAAGASGRRFLLVRASRGRDVLAGQLAAAGGQVDEVVAYRSVDVEQAEEETAALLRSGKIDWITVTSSAIARSLVRLFGADLGRTKLASLSPITSATLRELGQEPTVEAAIYTMPGLVAAIEAWQRAAEHRQS